MPDRLDQVFSSLQAQSDLGLSSLDAITGLATLLDIVRQRVADLAVPSCSSCSRSGR